MIFLYVCEQILFSMTKRGFASDNNAGVHPRIMKALAEINSGHCIAYGDDQYTAAAKEQFKKLFGECEVFFVFNGTGANVLSLQAMTQPFNAVICADTAHIHVDECGAPERFTGCKMLFNCTGLVLSIMHSHVWYPSPKPPKWERYIQLMNCVKLLLLPI